MLGALVNVAKLNCWMAKKSPALQIMTFDGSIERISCITQHGDFGPMTHQAILENVAEMGRKKYPTADNEGLYPS